MSRSVLYCITSGTSAGTLLRGQLEWMAERGWNVSLAVNPDERAKSAAEAANVPLERVPMERAISLRADAQALARLMRVMRRRRPEVVNVSTPKAALLGGIAAWFARVPKRIYVMRGLRVEGATGVMQAVLWLMEKVTVMAATDVVVVSESLAKAAHARRLIAPGGAWLVGGGSSNGVQADKVFTAAQKARNTGLREALGLSDEDIVVGYVGRLVADKGVGALLSALETIESPRVKLLIVGSIDEEPLGARVAALGSRVSSVDWTDDVWAYYGCMDVLCLPTRREGFPNVVLEAAAAGVPCVTTRATGAVNSVIDGRTGFLVGVDAPEELSRALSILALDPTRRVEMGSQARTRVLSDFVPERIWSGVESVMAGSPADHVRRV